MTEANSSQVKQIEDLIEKLNNYTKAYDEGHPKISNKEWDSEYYALQHLESETG